MRADDTGSHFVPPIPIAPMPTTGGNAPEPPAVTLAALRKLATQIVGSIAAAGILGAASLGAVSYMTLHDVQRDVVDVEAHHDEDMTRARHDVERRHHDHGANGHRDVAEGLHRIDLRLTAIESTLDQLQEHRGPARRNRR